MNFDGLIFFIEKVKFSSFGIYRVYIHNIGNSADNR